MNFQYTDAAIQELQAYQVRQQKMLEQLISERKFVFGDETVEVTASDIKEAAAYIRAYRQRIARYSSFRLVSQFYVVLGAAMAIGGYFYPVFLDMFQENRIQAMAIITGLVMMGLGWMAGYLYRSRIRRYEEMERMKELERSLSILKEKDRA